MASRFLTCHRPNGQGLRRLTSHSQKFQGGAKVDAKIAKGDAREAAKGMQGRLRRGMQRGWGCERGLSYLPTCEPKAMAGSFLNKCAGVAKLNRHDVVARVQ